MIDWNDIIWSDLVGKIPEIICVETLAEYAERLEEWKSQQPRRFKSVGKTYKAMGKTYTAGPSVPDTRHPFIPYLQKLFEPNDRVCIMGIHSTEKWESGQSKTHTWFQSLEMTVAEDSLSALRAQQANGWHLYVCMNPLVAGSTHRKKDRVAAIRSVYCEVDENGEAAREEMRRAVKAGEIPVPHYVIESSPGKFQFIWLVEGFATTAQQEQMNSSLQVRFKTDAASVDCVRVLRLPGFKNLKPKYGPDFPTSKIIFTKKAPAPRYRPEDFKIQIVDPVWDESYRQPIASEEINKILDFVTEALDESGVGYGEIKELPSGTLRIHLDECLWADGHSEGKRGDADVFVNSDGSLGFKCFHNFCAARDWEAFRGELESRAGHRLKFGESSGIAVGESVTEEEYRRMLLEQGIILPQPKTGKTVEPAPPKEIKPEPAKTIPTETTPAKQPAAPVESAEKAETPAEPPKEIKYEGDKRQLETEYFESLPKQPAATTAKHPAKQTEPTQPSEQAELTLPEGTPAATVTENKPDLTVSIEEKIPPYSTPIRGILAKAVDIVAGGTTMPRQFPNLIAKTYLGLRLAVLDSNFVDCPEPRLFSFLLGETGCSKGWSMERCLDLFTCFGKFGKNKVADKQRQAIKILSSIDSGAGLAQTFFTPPVEAGVLIHIGEAKNLMEKARADRNPEIMTQIIELANSKHLSIVKAKENKTTSNARLALVMACQPDALDTIFAGLKTGTLGFYDRMTLEFAEKVDPGDTPDLDPAKVQEFYKRMCDLKPMTIKQGERAKKVILDYWQTLPPGERKARYRQNIFIDQFLIRASQMAVLKGSARTSGETTYQDALDAVMNAQREAVIRHRYLRIQASNLVSVYIARIKECLKLQWAKIQAGATRADVAMTEVDYCTATRAYANNDEVFFKQAWTACSNYLEEFKGMPAKPGPKTKYYLPNSSVKL